ncbi:MAG TPA: 2OG-Fe(II) oxygenase [Streptosporangiaceae bacterium]|nr:2OG-Fe(II) oxygenase [Streptosporangiaceae bacterium]
MIDRLPLGWQDDIRDVTAEADVRDYPRTPTLSRESEDVTHITRGRVRADVVQERLPWLYKLYRGDFLELAEQAGTEPIKAAFDDRYGVVLNVQCGMKMRFECHVDSNPVTGLLFFTQHPRGGGELVVGHDPAAVGIDAVERDCTIIEPQAGQLIFFDGKNYPHYARALLSESDMRVVAVMNFYTGSCPESTRPAGLNRHLFGKD